jgi:hypothetical protein
MCDQGYNLTFHSKGCEIRKVGSGILVTNANRTLSNVYVFDEFKVMLYGKSKKNMEVVSLSSHQ